MSTPAMATERPVPPEHLNRMVGGTCDDFASTGEHFRDLLTTYAGLKPTHRVLDVGCGCGRLAVPLTTYLTTGSYEGFDIVPEAIEWCRSNITLRYPAFQFQCAEIHNSLYAATSSGKARDFRFPYGDASFDFVILTSVFTHMLQEDMEHYTREIARTLKPSGTTLITFFLLNRESERLMKKSGTTIRVPFKHGKRGVRIGHQNNPEAVVAYPEPLVRLIFAQSGLLLREPIAYGSWCGRKGTMSYQDITVSKKR